MFLPCGDDQCATLWVSSAGVIGTRSQVAVSLPVCQSKSEVGHLGWKIDSLGFGLGLEDWIGSLVNESGFGLRL